MHVHTGMERLTASQLIQNAAKFNRLTVTGAMKKTERLSIDMLDKADNPVGREEEKRQKMAEERRTEIYL